MHFLTIVVVPASYLVDPDNSPLEYVDRVMAPYGEESDRTTWVPPDPEYDAPDGGYWTNPNSFWDWYQIGGRWAGHFDPTYDPELDPINWETCAQCHGTGMRDDDVGRRARADDPSFTCNGCARSAEKGLPTGLAIKWPTEWSSTRGNVARMGDVRKILTSPEGRPYYVVHDGSYSEGDDFEHVSDDDFVVVVDCHS